MRPSRPRFGYPGTMTDAPYAALRQRLRTRLGAGFNPGS
ncbi:hypothetical protein FTUN_4061 [Frigoriglobus tundricola]|uniref:Uncharacterized protein n=1 Tax=Frigoriglobus tundricola TaxID=2774151 RepID=A0A6M5YSU4_9BACT|nr:hypothetical protein FTUN_4061 [Frigoriglobus tundricola]